MAELTVILALGKLAWWFVNHVCSGAIGHVGQETLNRIRQSNVAQRNHDLQRALHVAFIHTLSAFRDAAGNKDQRIVWGQISDRVSEWLEPERFDYPTEILDALLFEDADSQVWIEVWLPLRLDLDATEARPLFDENRRALEKRLRANFASILRTKPHEAGFIAYQQAMFDHLLGANGQQSQIQASGLATIEALASVPDLMGMMNEAILTEFGRQEAMQDDRLSATASMIGGLARGIDRLRLQLEGRYLTADGSLIHYDLVQNCDRVRLRLLNGAFAGRDTELEELTDGLKGGGYLSVSGPSGSGKSALLAYLIKNLKALPDTRVCYHFFSREDDTASLSGGMACIVEQLLAVHNISGRVHETETQRLQATLPSLLAMPHSSNLVVILDGIDEAVDAGKSGRFAIGQGWFPETLGEKVSMVLGVRYGAGLTDSRELGTKLGVRDVRDRSLGDLVQGDIGELLRNDRKHLAPEIRRSTDGLAIYVSNVVDAANSHETLSEATAAIHELPRDFSDYVGNSLGFEARQQRQWLDPLGFLAVAFGPINSADLLRLCVGPQPMHSLDLVDPSWQIARWLLPIEEDGNWAFQHDAIRRAYLSLIESEKDALLARLIDDCSNWSDHNGHYSLRYYAAHLSNAALTDSSARLYALALNNGYLEAQRTAFPRDPALPLETIQIAIRDAVANGAIPMAVKLMFAHLLEVNRYRDESPLKAADRGDFSRAVWLASLNDSVSAALWLLLLAWLETDHGRPENVDGAVSQLELLPIQKLGKLSEPVLVSVLRAKDDLIRHPRICAWINQHLDGDALASIAAAQATIGEVAAARASAEALSTVQAKADTLARIAEIQAASGDVDGAIETIAKALRGAAAIHPPKSRFRTLARIARAQAASGDGSGAQATSDAISDGRFRAESLVDIADAQAVSGDIAGALVTAQTIRRPDARARAFAAIALIQARNGDVGSAISTVSEIAGDRAKSRSLKEIAGVQAAAGNISGAIATIGGIKRSTTKARALAEIAIALARTGETVDAITTIDAISWPDVKISALATVAKLLSSYGDADGAKVTIRKANTLITGKTSTSAKLEALIRIAEAQTILGDVEGSKATLVRATESVETISEGGDRQQASIRILSTLASAGDAPNARARARSHLVAKARARAEVAIALSQATLGDSEGAIETVKLINDVNSRERALAAIADIHAASHNFGDAIGIALDMSDDEDKVRTLASIAASQAPLDARGAIDTFAKAIGSAEVITDENLRAESLVGIADAQAVSGDIAGALVTAQTIRRPDARARALAAIALTQARNGDAQAAQDTLATALATANASRQVDGRNAALKDVATAKAVIGYIDEAHSIAEGITDLRARSGLVATISDGQGIERSINLVGAASGDGHQANTTVVAEMELNCDPSEIAERLVASAYSGEGVLQASHSLARLHLEHAGAIAQIVQSNAFSQQST